MRIRKSLFAGLVLTPVLATPLLVTSFRDAHAARANAVMAQEEAGSVPLSSRSFIDLPSGRVLVNFNYVVNEGSVYTRSGVFTRRSQHIDLTANDALIKSIGDAEKLIKIVLEADGSFLREACLDKMRWTYEDRMAWEDTLSNLVSIVMEGIPGLDEYRTSRSEEYPQTKRRAVQLNDLSIDILEGTQAIEYDCEGMSVVEGIICQRIENALLPKEGQDPFDYRYAGSYFYASGYVAFANMEELSGHAYIVSGVTGNIIEATVDSDRTKNRAYNVSSIPDFSFESFVGGRPFVSIEGDVYTTLYDLRKEQIAQLRFKHTPQRDNGNIEIEYAELLEMISNSPAPP